MAFVGAYLTKDITNRTLEYITAIYFFLIGTFFFWNAYTGKYGEISDGKKSITHIGHGIKYLLQ